MEQLIKKVRRLVISEYERAAEIHGKKHNSGHEAYAVIREELQETTESTNSFIAMLEGQYWDNVRSNQPEENLSVAEDMMNAAILIACEAIQTAAMAFKATKGTGDDVSE